jgi:phage-related protein
VSIKPITGHSTLCEIRTGGYRTFYYVSSNVLVVLHCCKKQDQDRGIKLAYKRMIELEG